MSTLSSHVLDLKSGKPAVGLPIKLYRAQGGTAEWSLLGDASTDQDGRARTFAGVTKLASGRYRLIFAVGVYFRNLKQTSFYDDVPIDFLIDEGEAHYHVPLLLSPFGYSTYRGS